MFLCKKEAQTADRGYPKTRIIDTFQAIFTRLTGSRQQIPRLLYRVSHLFSQIMPAAAFSSTKYIPDPYLPQSKTAESPMGNSAASYSTP
jgi:hypothetical protein